MPADQQRPARRPWLGPGFIALAVLVGIGALFGAGSLSHSAATGIVGAGAESQIALGIQTQEGLGRVPVVTCPGREPVRPGFMFRCQVQLGGAPRTVYVTEIDGRGALRWSLDPPPAPAITTPAT